VSKRARPIVFDGDVIMPSIPKAVERYGGSKNELRWTMAHGYPLYFGHTVRYLIAGETIVKKPADPKPKWAYSLLGYRHVTEMLGAARQP
jgi:hypothetical protein